MIATSIRAAGFVQPVLELDTAWQASRRKEAGTFGDEVRNTFGTDPFQVFCRKRSSN